MKTAGKKREGALSDETLIRSFIHERFADMFLSQSRRAQSGVLIAALLIAFIWYSRTKSLGPLAWALAAFAVTTARFFYTERFVRGQGPSHATQRIGIVLLINGLLMAIPLTSFEQLSELERAGMSIILLAGATASTATTLGYRSIFLAFAAPMLLPMAAAWAWSPDRNSNAVGYLGIALLVVLFLLFLISVSRQLNLMFEESCRYRYGEQQLNRELKHALEQADESNRAKTQFLAAASHDLRQPIHSMNVLVAALTLREIDPGSKEIVVLLDSVNQTLSKQLDSLLDISKLDAGTVKPQLENHRLDMLVRSHHVTMAPVALERGLQFELFVQDAIGVKTDDALLGRILNNLTDNAFKYTPRGGRTVIALHQQGEHAVLTVTDTGIGISADECERVFREFYQVANVERDRSKGLGLGLSIVRRLCDLLGVELSLQSEVGVGTTVTMVFLTVASNQARSLKPVHAPIPPGLAVLVVDDEAVVRQSMRLLLTQLGCQVHTAEGTAQAICIARNNHVDVILSDYRLREGDNGLMTIKGVQDIHPTSRVALITGDTAPDRLKDAQSAGVPLLHKPVTLDNLLSVLRPDTA